MYVNTKEMLIRARKEHTSSLVRSARSLNSASALINAATELNMPLILMLWEGAPEPMAQPEMICDFVRYEAGKHMPIALHLTTDMSWKPFAERYTRPVLSCWTLRTTF